MVASSLIGIFYFLPIALIFSYFKKFKVSTKIVSFTDLVWAGSVMAIVVAEVSKFALIMTVSTGAFVLSTISIITLASLRIISKRLIH